MRYKHRENRGGVFLQIVFPTNPSSSQNFPAFGFLARNSYLCIVMQGDTTAQAKRADGRKTVQTSGRRCGVRIRITVAIR